jgi:hypothetical protein
MVNDDSQLCFSLACDGKVINLNVACSLDWKKTCVLVLCLVLLHHA